MKVTEIRCSGLSRPMTCRGSLFFENLPPQEENSAAKEGTAAGEYLERLLTRKHIPTHAANGVEFNDDMKFYTTPIAEKILSEAPSPILCETRIDWPTKYGLWIRGSYDVSYTKGDTLYIEDLKYGWNLVEVKENWQLIGYAIGEIIRQQRAFKNIIFKIHQPRPHHEDGPTRTWEISYETLLQYRDQIEEMARLVMNEDAQLVTGPKCRYCPAAQNSACPAFNRSFYDGIDYVLNKFQQDSIDAEEISKQLDIMGRVTEIMKIKQDSLNQLAVQKIRSGSIVPGYVLEDSYGDRQWKKGVTPNVIETLTGKKIIEEVILSPAKAEKLGVPKDLIATFVDRYFKGQKVVKKDDSKLGNKIFGSEKPK